VVGKTCTPLVLAALQWKRDRATREQDAYGRLSEVAKDMTSTFNEHASGLLVVPLGQGAKNPPDGSGSATDSGDSDSETAG
jgi:hypothetical protein